MHLFSFCKISEIFLHLIGRYPDGSRIETRAAYGIAFQNEYKEHSESGRVAGNQDNYRAEFTEINRFLDIVDIKQNVQIHSDSLSAIQKIDKNLAKNANHQTTRSDKEFIELIKATSGDILWDIIKKIHNRDEVGATTLITWCKPHVGIELNEKADELAKLGLQLPDNHIVPLTYDRDFKTSSGRDENSRGTRDPLTIHDKTELFEYFEKDDMERDKM
jgi:ribonuclease HI